MNQVLTTLPFSYRQSLLANRIRRKTLRLEGSVKLARFHGKKRRLYLAQRGKCCFCNRKTFLDSSHAHPSLLATFEHIQPRSKGGKDHIPNLKISCYHCNGKRGAMPYHEFLFQMTGRIIPPIQFMDAKKKDSPPKKKRLEIRKAQRNYVMLQDSYHILDGGDDRRTCHFAKNDKNLKGKALYNYYAMVSSYKVLDRTDLTLPNIPVI